MFIPDGAVGINASIAPAARRVAVDGNHPVIGPLHVWRSGCVHHYRLLFDLSL